MKKILSVLLVVLLCFGLCACNNSTSKNNQVAQETVDPIQERKDMLDEAFIKCCDADINFATLSSDYSALTIDTNPKDTSYSYYEDEATAAIVATNSFLNLPASVTEKMSSTRALDGMQSQNCGDFTVSWTYHPDNGLRVIYEVNFS